MILVDSNVLMDVFGKDPIWSDWSSTQISSWGSKDQLVINPLIYSEISVGFETTDILDEDLESAGFVKLNLPYAAAFRAARAFVTYRQSGGARRSPLADFYIGAHAEVESMRLLTRDVTRYRTYFPKLKLIAPN